MFNRCVSGLCVVSVDTHQVQGDDLELLHKIKSTVTKKTPKENECMLILFYPPELQHFLTVTGVNDCIHISCVTKNLVWVSDKENNLILINTKKDIFHHLRDVHNGYGVHTVNSDGELIYMDTNHNIMKLCNDMETTIILKRTTKSKWKHNVCTGLRILGIF